MNTKNIWVVLLLNLILFTKVWAQNPPSNPTCTYSCGKLNATWNTPSSGTPQYYEVEIYKDGVIYYTPINVGTVLSYTFPANNEVLEPGNYTFKVRSFSNGNFSSFVSPPGGISTNYNALSPTVSNIACKSFTISWNSLVTGCTSNVVTYKYLIYEGSTCGGSMTLLNLSSNNTTTNTSVVFNNALPGKFYKVRVVALSYLTETGLSFFPSTGCFQTPAIPVVTNMNFTNSSIPVNNVCNGFSFTWDGNACATHYQLKLWRCPFPSNGCQTGTVVSTTTLAHVGPTVGNQVHTFGNLTPSNYYRVEVIAQYQQNGNSLSNSNSIYSSWYQAPTPIAAPSNVRIISKCGRKVTIGWDASTDPRATGYSFDLSNSNTFSNGNFVINETTGLPMQNYIVNGAATNQVTLTLGSFAPFEIRSIHLRIKTLNSNNSCNSIYSNLYNIALYETAASISASAHSYFGAIEGSNSFYTTYFSNNFPHSTLFRYDPCITQAQIKIEMVNADGSIFNPTSTNLSAVSWSSPVSTNLSLFMQGPPSLSNFIAQNGGTVCNYNGIGTTSNLTSAGLSLLLAPKIQYGSQILSTGYHKITLRYWEGSVVKEYPVIVKTINSLDEFSLQYPLPSTIEPFTDYYYNTSSPNYHFGPGFNCRQFNNTINAKSNPPTLNVAPYASWDNVYPPNTKIIFSKANIPSEFYMDAANDDQIIGEKLLSNIETTALRAGSLNLISLFNSLNINQSISYIGIRTGAGYGSSVLPSVTKIMAFGYTAKPTDLQLVHKCANEVKLKWVGNGNAAGTNYLVTIGSNYNATTNSISNFATSGAGASLVTYNNYSVTLTELQVILNAPHTNYFVQVKANNAANGCVSAPSNVINFKTNLEPVRILVSSDYNSVNCLNSGVFVTFEFDDCIDQTQLHLENVSDNTNTWTGPMESKSTFINKYTNTFNNSSLWPWLFGGNTIQNYINHNTPNANLLWFGGYDGYSYKQPSGKLLKSFIFYDHPYKVRINYKKIGLPTTFFVEKNEQIKFPNYPVTVRRSNGNPSPHQSPRPVPNLWFGAVDIDCYQNYRFLSISAPNSSLSCLGNVKIEFSNSLTVWPTPSSPDLKNQLNSSPGIDIISLANVRGFTSFPVYIKILYSSGGAPSGSELGAIYVLNYYNFPGYPNGNSAYQEEGVSGFNDFVLFDNPAQVFTYDHNNQFYFSGADILVPDLSSTLVSNTNFFGFSGGTPSSNNFQWDNVGLAFSGTGAQYDFQWDKLNMFVSPFSPYPMDICNVLDFKGYSGVCNNLTQIPIDDPIYPSNPNLSGNYVGNGLHTIDDLIMDQGNVDVGGDLDYVIQQSNNDNTYCVHTYGKGWRLPTATELGKDHDFPSMNFNTNPGYFENSTGVIWTSSLWQNNNSFWEAIGNFSSTTIAINNNFYNTHNYVRCVYGNN